MCVEEQGTYCKLGHTPHTRPHRGTQGPQACAAPDTPGPDIPALTTAEALGPRRLYYTPLHRQKNRRHERRNARHSLGKGEGANGDATQQHTRRPGRQALYMQRTGTLEQVCPPPLILFPATRHSLHSQHSTHLCQLHSALPRPLLLTVGQLLRFLI